MMMMIEHPQHQQRGLKSTKIITHDSDGADGDGDDGDDDDDDALRISRTTGGA